MRSATAATPSCSATRRAVASGISRVSRAMALTASSGRVMRQSVDYRSQIALMLEQGVHRPGLFPSETEQHGNLDVALGAFDEFGGIVLVASDDLADDDRRTAQQFRVAGAHAHHQAPVDAA